MFIYSICFIAVCLLCFSYFFPIDSNDCNPHPWKVHPQTHLHLKTHRHTHPTTHTHTHTNVRPHTHTQNPSMVRADGKQARQTLACGGNTKHLPFRKEIYRELSIVLN